MTPNALSSPSKDSHMDLFIPSTETTAAESHVVMEATKWAIIIVNLSQKTFDRSMNQNEKNSKNANTNSFLSIVKLFLGVERISIKSFSPFSVIIIIIFYFPCDTTFSIRQMLELNELK